MPIAFITGIGGFSGSHLADLLLALNWKVSGTIVPGGDRSNLVQVKSEIEAVDCDVRDRAALGAVIALRQPDVIFHLAAKTAEHDTRTNPQLAFDVTAMGTVNVLESVRAAGLEQTRVLVAGSSAEYGRVLEAENPMTESQPHRPVGMYGVTKIAQSMIALQYHLAYGMKIIRTRAFNHTGPRQAERFATPAFAKQVAEIEAGIRPPILHVGDLSQRRDLSDVRDVVRGYVAAAMRGKPGEVYNIAAGSAVRTQAVLDGLIAMSSVKIEVAVDPDRLRPGEVAVQVGDSGKLRHETGWRSEIALEKTLADTLEFWRKKIKPRRGANE